MTDDVLREVRATREAFARSHGYDVYAMAAALRRLDEAGDRLVVRLPPRRPVEARSSPEGSRQGRGTAKLAAEPTAAP